jgi:hypothetical protein
MADWVGEGAERALPFGYSPTMFWLLLPFHLFSLPVAYFTWTILSGVALAWMVLTPRFHTALAVGVLVTPPVVAAFSLGQTAFLGMAGVFFLASRSLSPGSKGERTRRFLSLSVALWALGAKPPLAIAAGCALLAVGCVGPVALAVGLSVIGAATLTPWLGPGWVTDYLALIGDYHRGGADPAFAWSLVPEHMSNLRAMISVDLMISDQAASRISNLCWILSSGMVIIAGVRKRIRPTAAWALAILSYLLFCSHVSSTDELLLLLIPALITPRYGVAEGFRGYGLWLVVLLALFLSPALGPMAGVRPSLLFLVEVGLAVWIFVQKSGIRRNAAEEMEPQAI